MTHLKIVKPAIATLLIITGCFAGEARYQTQPVDSAICQVCSIWRADYSQSPVKAESEYKDNIYRFCSDSCKQRFDNNPEYFIDPPLPRPAPEFALPALTGARDSLENYRGKIMLVDFWASWCAPCKKTMKDLESIFRENRAESLIVLGITLDSLGNLQTALQVEINGITYPILFDDRISPTWLAYGVKAIPSLYLVDRDGQIVRQWRGASEKSEIEAAVMTLLSKSGTDPKK